MKVELLAILIALFAISGCTEDDRESQGNIGMQESASTSTISEIASTSTISEVEKESIRSECEYDYTESTKQCFLSRRYKNDPRVNDCIERADKKKEKCLSRIGG